MAWKELRETGQIVLPALVECFVCFSGVLWSTFDLNLGFLAKPPLDASGYVPFVYDEFFSDRFFWVGAAVTIALGLRQTLGESIHGTYPFLLHRPAGRLGLTGMKLLVGLGAYLICGAMVILLYGLWAATPGKHASPFEWSMTWSTWVVLFQMTLFYLAAFLSGIRPARWFGTRLLPLAVAALTLLLTMEMGGPLLKICVVAAADACMVVAILFVAQTRDYA
jgi:hypothetical protein